MCTLLGKTSMLVNGQQLNSHLVTLDSRLTLTAFVIDYNALQSVNYEVKNLKLFFNICVIFDVTLLFGESALAPE